jgi:hypothetical protein
MFVYTQDDIYPFWVTDHGINVSSTFQVGLNTEVVEANDSLIVSFFI